MKIAYRVIAALTMAVVLNGCNLHGPKTLTHTQAEAELDQVETARGMTHESPARSGLPVYPKAVSFRSYPPRPEFATTPSGSTVLRVLTYWVGDASPDRVLDFYSRALNRSGWSLVRRSAPFKNRSPWAAIQATYDRGRQIVRVTAYKDRETRRTEVSLSLEEKGISPSR
jgi:hypothetical protein